VLRHYGSVTLKGDTVTLLYLVRHAEQEHTPDEDPSVGISVRGGQQARLLGQRLGGVPFDGIHHSPVTRAEETARLVAESLPGVPVHASALLTDRTPYPSPEQRAVYPAQSLPWLATVPVQERDEGGAQISAAMHHFARLADDAPTSQPQPRRHLLVTHAFVIGAMVREALDAPAWRWIGLRPFNCALTVIRCEPEQQPTLISFNDIGHLPLEVRGRAPLDLLI
jgi:serine/threonine-protein phosphatase PGAM5